VLRQKPVVKLWGHKISPDGTLFLVLYFFADPICITV